jgi:uncharacterized heparinase superfamily protein
MRQRVSEALGIAAFPDRLAAWSARRVLAATGFVSQPEPRSIGLHARGKQLLSGNVLLAGFLAQAPGVELWDIPPPDPAFQAEAQGFGWLDDLVALGSSPARTLAQGWTWGWIDRYSGGGGPGWSPDLAGRRIIRWSHHALFLLQGRDKPSSDAFFLSLSRQAAYLARRWKAARPGLPRFEALTGLLYAGLSLIGKADLVDPALTALARDCSTQIDASGALPTRNPEELLDVLTLLTWAIRALAEADRPIPEALSSAIDRAAAALRVLRHADGGLARFHDGGRGMDGRLDQALATAGVRAFAQTGLAMGFARMTGGRTTVIVDAAAPPEGRASLRAHASTNALELTSGRRPVVVSCGSGRPFGEDWQRAGRATPSHSTLAVDGFSSSRLASEGPEVLADRAMVTVARLMPGENGTLLHLVHSGWAATHGLSHVRDLSLSTDGRRLSGIDKLSALSTAEKRRFERLMTDGKLEGVAFAVRFHLHPDVDARLDLGGAAVSLALKSGEIWVFRHDGAAFLTLEPSVYLENTRLRPRAARQIVLTARAVDFETRLGWTLAKAQDTPLAIRDLEREDLPLAAGRVPS